MAFLLALLAVQFVVAAAGGVFLWRRQEQQRAEIAALREALDEAQAQSAAPRRRAQQAEVHALYPLATDTTTPTQEAPMVRAARAWNLLGDERDVPAAGIKSPTLSPETARGLTLALIAMAPAIGFLFGADVSAMVAAGLAIAAAMMAIALRPMWRAAAWAGVLTAGAWAMIGFALSAAHAEPISYSIFAAIAGAAGLAHAHVRRAAPGVTMALVMAAATLALGSQTAMAGPAGLGFAAIAATAAIIGALTLRLESVHLASFGAALIGLFVLSGQETAAIWFTPAVAWAGALYFAIAAVRVPQLGARGVALAGTGALAPLAAIAALHIAQHGLANAYAAAGAFFVLAGLLAGLIGAAALRRERGLLRLRLTLWVLAAAAFTAIASALALALPAPLAAPAFATTALALVALNLRLPNAAWRTFACIAALLALVFASLSAELLLAEAQTWPPYAVAALATIAPACLFAASAYAAERADSRVTAGWFEAAVMIFAIGAANLIVRLIGSGGATILMPVSFVETMLHISVWLAAALAIGLRVRHGVRGVRFAAINVLLIAALGAVLVAVGLWLIGNWNGRLAPSSPLLARDTLGFLLPGLLLAAHWYFWRQRGAEVQTRLAAGAGALLLAAFITLEAMRVEGGAWLGAVAGAFSFAMAVGINFAPHLTRASAARRRLKSREKFPSQSARTSAR